MRTIVCTVTALLLLHMQQAAALSWSLCDTYNAEWVTDSPRLRGRFPFSSLVFNCNGGINVEGKSVDACIGSGQQCGQPAANAFCKYIGFDGASEDTFDVELSDVPTRSMTGEWCMFAGKYEVLGDLNRTQYDALNASTASMPRCNRLSSVTCFRSRANLASAHAAIDAAMDVASMVPAPALAPAAEAAPVVFPVGSAILQTPLPVASQTPLPVASRAITQSLASAGHSSPSQALPLASGGRRLKYLVSQ